MAVAFIVCSVAGLVLGTITGANTIGLGLAYASLGAIGVAIRIRGRQ